MYTCTCRHGFCPYMRVGQVLQWLAQGTSTSSRSLFLQLLFLVSHFIEEGAWVRGASTDFLQAPLPQGPKRRRRIATHLKEAVAAEGAKAGVGRSGAKVLQVVSRTKGCKQIKREGHANTFDSSRVARYWQGGKAVLRRMPRPWVSVTCDATRAGGQDMLFSALHVASLDRSMWLPPQVPQ